MERKGEYNKSKIRWRCNRGMLELDLILQPFTEKEFDALSSDLKDDFVGLLKLDDIVLFAWLLGHEAVDDEKYLAIVQCITAKSVQVSAITK